MRLFTALGMFNIIFLGLFLEWSITRAQLRHALDETSDTGSPKRYARLYRLLSRLVANLDRWRTYGLVGTVAGIILAFFDLERGQTGTVDLITYVLQDGLALALLTTLVGLVGSDLLGRASETLMLRAEMWLIEAEASWSSHA